MPLLPPSRSCPPRAPDLHLGGPFAIIHGLLPICSRASSFLAGHDIRGRSCGNPQPFCCLLGRILTDSAGYFHRLFQRIDGGHQARKRELPLLLDSSARAKRRRMRRFVVGCGAMMDQPAGEINLGEWKDLVCGRNSLLLSPLIKLSSSRSDAVVE